MHFGQMTNVNQSPTNSKQKEMNEIPVPDFSSLDNENEETKRERLLASENLSFRHIMPCELISMMQKPQFEYCLDIIDCRFDYEYKEGHIIGARAIDSINVMKDYFNFPETEKSQSMDDLSCIKLKKILIFHCEYSKNRGPEIASTFRKIDRSLNINNYPKLFYPKIYILKGGYKEFYQHYPQLCIGVYAPMISQPHLVRRKIKQRNSLLDFLLHKEEKTDRIKLQQKCNDRISISQPSLMNISFIK